MRNEGQKGKGKSKGQEKMVRRDTADSGGERNEEALELTEEERAMFRLEGEEKDEEDGEGVELTMGVDDLSDESSADEDRK